MKLNPDVTLIGKRVPSPDKIAEPSQYIVAEKVDCVTCVWNGAQLISRHSDIPFLPAKVREQLEHLPAMPKPAVLSKTGRENRIPHPNYPHRKENLANDGADYSMTMMLNPFQKHHVHGFGKKAPVFAPQSFCGRGTR